MSENQEHQEQDQAPSEGAITSSGDSAAIDHHGPDFAMYLKVFIALCVCTAASFFAFKILGHGNAALIAIMLISMVKAYLVTSIFMHLKWDWGNLYFLIIPAFILGVVLILVLLPDIVYLPYPAHPANPNS